MCIVKNKYKSIREANDVYIGRGSIFGNPFVIGKDGDRDQVIEKYAEYLKQNPALVLAAKQQLRGKNLVCFCAPQRCHGDVLLAIANEPSLQELL